MKTARLAAVVLFLSLLTAVFLLSPAELMSGVQAKPQLSFEQPYLVKNINERTEGSYPYCVAVDNSFAVCRANEGLPGVRLWRSNGTKEGTFVLKEIFADRGVIRLNKSAVTSSGTIFFFAEGGCCKYEYQLWISDGTSKGTRLVKDLTGELEAGDLVTIGDTLYFIMTNYYDQTAIWQSDGTSAGTRLFKKINGWENGRHLVSFQERLYFNNSSTAAGSELWVSEGTKESTFMLADIYPGRESSEPDTLTAARDYLFFYADDGEHNRELWRTDGTVEGTKLVKDIHIRGASNSSLTAAGKLVFWGDYDYTSGNQILMRSDGSEAGTFGIPIPVPYDIDSLTAAANNVYITFESEEGPFYFWRSDGTEDGTFQLKKLGYVPSQCYGGYRILPAGKGVYFPLTTAKAGCELWHSDGTEEGTRLVQDIEPGTQSSQAAPLAYVNKKVLLTAANHPHDNDLSYPDDHELWATDGGPKSAELIKEFNRTPYSSYPTSFFGHDGWLFLAANDGYSGHEFWKSDGTATGTKLIADIREGKWGSDPQRAVTTNNGLVFSADTSDSGRELFVSDGTTAGTILIKEFTRDSYDSNIGEITEWNGMAFFNVRYYGDEAYEFWRSDGTTEGTVKLGGFEIKETAGAGKVLYFIQSEDDPGESDDGPVSLWYTNGTRKNTVKVAGPRACGRNHDMAFAGDTLYFAWCDKIDNIELWMLPGPAEEPQRVADINPTGSSNPQGFAVFNGAVYFAADDGTTGYALWTTDGTAAGTKKVKDVEPYDITPFNKGFFFLSEGLWVSDGTEARTKPLKDIYVQEMVASGDYLFLSANDGEHGFELMISDGTSDGTVLVADIVPGAGDSEPHHLTPVADKLFFAASDVLGDMELWAMPLPAYSPKAEFSASPLEGTPPLEVAFTNLSSGDFDTCLWDFGDGKTKTTCEDTPHNYRQEGHYTVSLTVSGPGGEDAMTMEEYIVVENYHAYLPGVVRP